MHYFDISVLLFLKYRFYFFMSGIPVRDQYQASLKARLFGANMKKLYPFFIRAIGVFRKGY